MAVVPDPHYQEPGNMQTGEAVTPIGTKYRMLFPAHAPFIPHPWWSRVAARN